MAVEPMRAPQNLFDEIISRLQKVTGPDSSGNYTALCPFHEDHNPSLSVHPERGFLCFGCKEKGTLRKLALKLGITLKPVKRATDKIIATYDYRDENGELLYQVCRLEPKSFRQRRPDPRNKTGWSWNVKDVKQVPYRLPALLQAPKDDWVFVVEGEKDADRLTGLGLIATTNSGGAKKWRAEFARYFENRKVAILPDNDEVGREHARKVAQSLVGKAAEVKIVTLPDLPEKGDVSDWLAAGHNMRELLKLVEAAPVVSEEVLADGRDRKRWQDKKDKEDKPLPWFSEDGTFIPPVLAEHILQKEKIVYDRGELYVYQNGVYRPKGEGYIRKLTLDLLGDDFREHRAREVVFYIQTKLYDSVKLDTDPRYINLENGLLDWMADPPRLLPHTPEFYSSIRIPVRYDPDAKCPAIDKFFREVLPEDCIDLAEELFGYCLIPDTRFEKAVMLVGSGENGKSTFLKLLINFLGRENVSGEALQELAENRFRAAELSGKLANIFPDLESRALESTAIFKALVTGDLISVERKHKDPFQLENKARLLFSANEIPLARDKSHAYYRRWLIIRFPNTFPPGKRDPGLLDKLTQPEELSGLLNRAITGLIRLFTNERFSEPESIRAELEKYQQANDTVRGFIADQCVINEKAFVGKQALYDAYKEWCEEGTYRPLSQRRFNERLLLLAPQVREDRNYGARMWRGIGLIDEQRDNDIEE